MIIKKILEYLCRFLLFIKMQKNEFSDHMNRKFTKIKTS